MHRNTLKFAAGLLVLTAVGCGDDPATDAGTDAAVLDVGGSDVVDAGQPDVQRLDAGQPDVGTLDAGQLDAGQPDVGTPDAGQPDVGTPDAGQPDVPAPTPGDTWALTSTGRLISFDRATGMVRTTTTITGLGAGETAAGLDIRPRNGALVLLTRDASNMGRLSDVALATGAASSVRMLSAALTGTRFGVDFNPAADALRIVSDMGQNLRVNPTTGATTVDGVLNPVTTTVASAAYTNSQDDTCRTQLFVIDTGTDRLRLQNPPNAGTLTDVGTGLGVDATGAVGFDIVTTLNASSQLVNAGLATLTVGGATRIYDVDLTTGVASGPRAFTGLASGEDVIDIAAPTPAATATPVQDPGEYWGLTEGGQLVSFNRAAPRNFCTTSAITGLVAGETIVGIDTRAATIVGQAKLYGIGRRDATVAGARLLAFDVTNPRAVTVTGSALLSPATGTAFAGLTGTSFAVDFNPAADLLRVIGSDGQNLRIVPPGRVLATPAILDPAYTTFTDGPLNDGATTPAAVAGVTEAAYFNNDEDALTTTTLYALDTTLDRLLLIGANPSVSGACPTTPGNPNCGVVTAVGSFGLASTDVVASGGFEISTAGNLAVAALRIEAAATSTLYDINLMTGAATVPAGIGTNDPVGTTNRIVGLTRRVVP